MGVAPAELGLSLDDLAPPAGADPAAVQPYDSSPPPSVRIPGSSGLTWRVATGAEMPPEMSSAEVVAAYLRGEVDDETHFWREGMISWERANDIPELRAALVVRGLSPKAPSVPPESAVPPAVDDGPSSPFSSPDLPQDVLADDFDDVTIALDVNRTEHLLRESAAPPPVDDLRAPLSFHDLPSAPAAASGQTDWQRPSSHSLPLPTPTPPPRAAARLSPTLGASDSQAAAPRKSALPWVGLAAAIVGAAAMFGLYATGNFPGQNSGDGQAARPVAPENTPENAPESTPEDARLANSAGTPTEAKAAVQAAAGGEVDAQPEVTQAAGTDLAAEKEAEEEAAKAQAALVVEAAAKAKAEEAAAKAAIEAKAITTRDAQLKAEIEARAEAEEAARAAAAAKLDAEAKAVAKKQAQEAAAKRAAERQIAANNAAAAEAAKKAAAARAARKAAEEKAAAEKAAAAPKPFSKSRATHALGVSAQSISSCKTPGGPRGSGNVKVTFSPDGVVRRALIQGSLAGTPAGGCIARVFRKTKIAPFAGGPQVVTKGFRL